MNGRNRVAFLDALRFTAAAAVLLQHALEINGDWGREITATLSPGVFGVVLFFLVSGFVIPLSVTGRLNVTSFVIRRLFRIMPLVLVTFALVALVLWAQILPGFGPATKLAAGDWIANLLLVQDYVGATTIWGVTWTLSVEFAWYALFAASYVVMGRHCDGFLVIAMPLGLLTLALGSILVNHRIPLAHFGLIYAAVLGARVYRHHIGELTRAALLRDAGVFALTMSICNIVSFGYFSHPAITLQQALYPWLAAAAFFTLVSMVPALSSSRLLCSKPLQAAGMVSFSIYLLHPLAIAIAISWLPPGWFLPGVVVATALLSQLGYYLVERPGQRLGRLLIDRSGGLRTAAAP